MYFVEKCLITDLVISWNALYGTVFCEDDVLNSYNQIREELKKYSKNLLNKREIVVLNKIDLVSNKELEEKKNKISKKIKKKILTLSTIEKKSVSLIKSKLIKYVS